MIIDDKLEFCDAQALNTGAAGSYVLGDDVNIAQIRDIGNGQPIYLVIVVSTTATSGGSATGQFSLVTDSTIATSSPVVLASRAWPVASMTVGTVLLCVPLPSEGTAYNQKIGLVQTTGTAAFTAGAVNAFLTLDPAIWKAYDDAVS